MVYGYTIFIDYYSVLTSVDIQSRETFSFTH